MSTLIDEVVTMTISRDSVGVTRADFGTILILGNSKPDLDPNLKSYFSLSEVVEDFETDKLEYIIASKIFAQNIKPDKIVIAQVHSDDSETFVQAYNRISLNYGNSFYGVVLTSQVETDILAITAVVQTQKKLLALVSNDPGVKINADGNILKQLKTFNYSKSFLVYTDILDYVNAAWLGRMLPIEPGSATWAFKSLVGIAGTSLLNASNRAAIKENSGNYYMTLAGSDVTFQGTVISGEYIDVIHGIDWMESFIQENIIQLLKSVPKIPMNNAGIGLVENSLNASLEECVARGIINPNYTITVPKSIDISVNDKLNRSLVGVNFNATVTGAIHNIAINGHITV
jgi:Protein of unknown function (DUF3383)